MVVPALVCLWRWECIPVLFVGVERAFYFAVGLGVFDTAKYLFDAVIVEEFLEVVLSSVVAGELAAVVAYAFLDWTVFEGFFHALNACFLSWAVAFKNCEQRSARIVEYFEDPNTIIWTLVPVNVHSCQAVPSLVSDPVFLSYHLFVTFLGKALA